MKKTMQNDRIQYIVRAATPEVPGVTTLLLTKEDGSVPNFTPGQYINVYFPETRTPEGKAYSVSSAPDDPTLSITVRAIGEFSNRLCAMRPGDRLLASMPYGFFCSEYPGSTLVMLAAGIGITPFRSIVRNVVRNTPTRRMALFHGTRTLSDAVFFDEFSDLRRTFPHVSVTRFITRENPVPSTDVVKGRMKAREIVSRIGDVSCAEFLICGSISFTRDMWRDLKKAGVHEEKLYTEAFFSH